MTSSAVAFRAILAKDLRAELRTLQSLPAMALFAVTTFVIFRFGLDRTARQHRRLAGVFERPKTFRKMAHEISDSHFAAGDECRIAGEEADGNQQADNNFDYSCHTEQ